tara:strand:+ start:1350 stop:1688 length:339 start_codon:yes stop_codon:yes gene_type:complete
MILASRLTLESSTILDGIEEDSRRKHAETVLSQVAETLQEYEARRPVADALDEVVRTMERVRAHLDQAEEAPNGVVGVLSSIDARTWVAIILGIATALGAATAPDVASLLGE